MHLLLYFYNPYGVADHCSFRAVDPAVCLCLYVFMSRFDSQGSLIDNSAAAAADRKPYQPRRGGSEGPAKATDWLEAQAQPQQQQQQPRNISAANSGYNSDSGSEPDELFNHPADDVKEEEEDMFRREEELRAELNFATLRVEELKRTLQETKSFLGPRLPTRGRDLVSAGKVGAVLAGMAVGIVKGPSEDLYNDEEEDDEDLYDLDDSDGDQDVSDARAAPVKAGNSRADAGDEKLQLETGDATYRFMKAPEPAVNNAYIGLQDAPSPSGKLADRIPSLRQRCIEGLGREAFSEVYNFLRQHEMVSCASSHCDNLVCCLRTFLSFLPPLHVR